MEDITADELRNFAQQFAHLASRAHELLGGGEGPRVSELVLQYLDARPEDLVSVGETFAAVERPNLQLAIDEFVQLAGGDLIGLPAELTHYGGFSLTALASGAFRGPDRAAPPMLDEISIGVDAKLGCVRAGLWLTTFDGAPVVIGVHPGERHGPGPAELRLDAIATDRGLAKRVRNALEAARHRHNVYRGQVLSFSFSEYGDFGITFMTRPDVDEDNVILAPGVLASIRRHTVDMADHAEALRAAGQHLKRGVLLHGPPGTGKTHTIGHLMAAMPERTVVVLQGMSVGALGHAAAIVRSLPPSMLVIEDVDLIAMERSMHPMGGGGLMFQLLNEMDGLGDLDDVIFVLTTNRIELLEPALAARPGRIDHAVEIGLPGASAREALFELYLADADIDAAALAQAVERTADTTGAFIKEAARRAVTASIMQGASVVSAEHILGAVDEMLSEASPVQAAMLGGPGAAARAVMPRGMGAPPHFSP